MHTTDRNQGIRGARTYRHEADLFKRQSHEAVAQKDREHNRAGYGKSNCGDIKSVERTFNAKTGKNRPPRPDASHQESAKNAQHNFLFYIHISPLNN